MKHETVHATSFAMPLTTPAFPTGPYRFINRAYCLAAAELNRHPMTPRSPRTLTAIPEILSAIRTAAKAGDAISNEELAPGIRSMAVPVLGANGDVVATVSVSAASARVKVSDLRKRILPVLLHVQNRLRSH